MADVTITQGTVSHALSATTPDNPTAEIQPQHWNSAHAASFVLAAAVASALFSNANGMSFGLSDSAITGSYTVPVQSVQTQASGNIPRTGFTTTTVGGAVVAGTHDTAGILMAVPAYITTYAAQSVQTQASGNIAGAGFTSTTTAGADVKATQNSAGLSFAVPAYLTTAQAPGAYLTTARASNDALGLNTAATNVTWTANSAGVSINAGGYAGTGFTSTTTAGTEVKATVNTAGVSMAVPAYLTAAAGGGAGAGTGFTTTTVGGAVVAGTLNSDGLKIAVPAYLTTAQAPGAYLTTARASNDAIGLNTALTANGVAWTVNSSGLSLNVPAYLTTAALSNHSHGNPTLALTNLTGTTASASDGFTLSLSAAAPGGGAGATLSRFDFMMGEPFANTTSLTVGGSSVFVQPFALPVHVSASYLRFPVSAGFGSSTFASTANTTVSLGQSLTQFFCIYSQGVGASSKSIQSLYSGSLTMGLRVDYRVGAASGNQSCSHHLSYGAEGFSTNTFSTSYAPAASSILRVSTTHLTAFTGPRFMDVPFATLLTPGAYWIAFQSSSATAVTGVAGMSNLTSRNSYYALSQLSANIKAMGANTTVGSNMWQGDGHGWWTTNTFGRTTDSMALSQISTIANQPLVPFRFDRHAE